MAIILLVDNDPLRAFLRTSLLERRFDDVRRVGDAAEALCLVEQQAFARALGLVVCGVQAPGFGGAAFVEELHRRLPELKVLVLGGAGESVGDYAGSWVSFLAAPFATGEMVKMAEQLLAQRERQTA